jgi:hypothetical protein
MLAYFHNGNFVSFWQDQRHTEGFVEATIKAMGHKPNEVEIYACPPPRNDESYYFDDQKRLVTGTITEIIREEGKPEKKIFGWNDPIELEKIYPAQ